MTPAASDATIDATIEELEQRGSVTPTPASQGKTATQAETAPVHDKFEM